MKIAAVLFILSVCYIASTEQAAVPTGVHTYPMASRSWNEMEHKAQQGMEEFKAKAKEVDPQGYGINIELLRACANQQCDLELHALPGCVEVRDHCRELLKTIPGPAMATYQAW